jgi:FkbM family methyltransferase
VPTLGKTIKRLVKAITPPVIYAALQRAVTPRIDRPQWNTVAYEPLKGFQIFFDPRGTWQSKMLTDTYDKYFFDRIREMDLRNKVVYDIGAHIGFHSFYISSLAGPGSTVHAFEPHPKNVERINLILQRNAQSLNAISVHPVAVSDKAGTELFTLHDDIESGRSSGNFIDSADTFWNKDVYAQKGFLKTTVRTVPIDHLLDELGIEQLPDVMKIDVEGAEHLVLLGARTVLLSKKPLLFIEIHSMLNMFNVLEFLESVSYDATVINTDSLGVCFVEAHARE